MKLRVRPFELPLRAPFVSATGSLTKRELLLVELEDADGVVGYGEAAPLESYDGVGIESARAGIEDCRGLLAASDGTDREDLLAACWQAAVLPQSVAGIDLALWDLAGRRASQPVWKLLGAVEPSPVEVNATIASADRAGASAEAAAAAKAGFGCIKVKVGVGDDAGRLAAVRAAAGPEVAIRLGANAAWSVDEAIANLRVMEPVGIELCEEPVSGLEPNRAVAHASGLPTALDESSALSGAFSERFCTAVCLKIARCGGISGLLDTAQRARRVGYEVYLASTLDGPAGISAALCAAAVIRPDRPSGLATLSLFDGLEAQHGRCSGKMAPSSGPGLA